MLSTPVHDRLRRVLPAAIGLAILVAALVMLRVELRTVDWTELKGDVVRTPPGRLALAAMLTALNFVALSGYDFIAFAYIGKRLPWRVVVLASSLAHAIANTIGFATVTGAAMRYRFYTRWGVSAEELSRMAFSYGVSFWLGLLALGGLSLALRPLPSSEGLPAAGAIRILGWLLMTAPLAYLTAAFVRRQPIRIRHFELAMPSFRQACAQLAVSCVDWALAASVLYVLLPAGAPPFLEFLGAFNAAFLLGLVSHAPGGVGVFDWSMMRLLAPVLTPRQLIPALLVFRAVYYLAPFVVSVALLAADELIQDKSAMRRGPTTPA